MYSKKKLFITFEGIEGSGKSYQSKKLYKKLRSRHISSIYTREPGGSISAEKIRKIILTGKKNKFDVLTDTLLYLASRNEHVKSTIIPAIKKKKIIICDRFTDSTLAYQVYGRGVDKSLIRVAHKAILNNIKPDLTFILKVNISKANNRLKKRKKINRYDKFSKKFYIKVQNSFIKLAKKNKRRYIVLNTSLDTKDTENFIYKKVISILQKWKTKKKIKMRS